jgi:hypothetical protein
MTVDLRVSIIQRHPHRPVILWAAGKYFFALNLAKKQYECWRRSESLGDIRDLVYFSNSEKGENLQSTGYWLSATDDKCIFIFDDIKYQVKHRFLLRKRPVGVLACENGKSLLWGDKFGDLMKVSICDLQLITLNVLQETEIHCKTNQHDKQKKETLDFLKEKFKNYLISNSFLRLNDEDTSASSELLQSKKIEWAPFAGHTAAITSIKITPNQEKVISADRDDKIRIGSVTYPHVTHGYCLGHTEMVTCLCCLNDSFLLSGSGDRTLRLWNIEDEGEEIYKISLGIVPSAIYTTTQSHVLVIGEYLKGVLVFTIQKNSLNTLTITPHPMIDLLSPPLCILPIILTQEEHDILNIQKTEKASQNIIPEIGFYWVDHLGKLHIPVSLATSKSLATSEQEASWIGMDVGEDIVQQPLHLWKHNRTIS